jgi:hypothetical protein
MSEVAVFPPTIGSRWTVQWRNQVNNLLYESAFRTQAQAEAFAERERKAEHLIQTAKKVYGDRLNVELFSECVHELLAVTV